MSEQPPLRVEYPAAEVSGAGVVVERVLPEWIDEAFTRECLLRSVTRM